MNLKYFYQIMNEKIAFAMLISFIITGSALILMVNLYPDVSVISPNHPFFEQNFDPDLKKIFIFGSSHVGVLNSTLISNNISENYSDYDFYNLSHSADNPEERLVILSEIISLNPAIVFYGISYRDLGTNLKLDTQDFHFDFNLVLKTFDPENKFKLKNINPKIITLKAINTELKKIYPTTTVSKPTVFSDEMPFYPQELLPINLNRDELTRHAEFIHVSTLAVKPSSSNEQVSVLKDIIKKLQKNNVQVVVFAIPLPHEYTNMLPPETKENFKEILNEIEFDLDLKVYDFTHQYDELSIWADSLHVATVPESIIYTEDVLEMILLEIEK
jgi:hypothetical protein